VAIKKAFEKAFREAGRCADPMIEPRSSPVIRHTSRYRMSNQALLSIDCADFRCGSALADRQLLPYALGDATPGRRREAVPEAVREAGRQRAVPAVRHRAPGSPRFASMKRRANDLHY
jgi:hypothetical protein